jgi:predicted nucleotidyltransferase
MRAHEFITESEKLFPAIVSDILRVVPEAEEIWFHGSRATGTHRRNSDWDILVTVDLDKLKDREYFDIVLALKPLNAKYKKFDIQASKKNSYEGSVEYWARKEGKLLWKNSNVAESKIKSTKEFDEDYSPDNPPGPEFKPTMPKGTVRVDVSDVYDWYKLGQHISNLKGLGKHDFGQGPPSTILSFGDEDTEHEYIQDLEKTGLTTTDIDPVDPNQPKSMKRQKTDPTFNVNEVSGYIPSKKQANDPRFKTALTKDVKPDSIQQNAKAFGFKTSRAGIPPLLRK